MENIGLEIPNYINLLERTNQQLSLWYNPYGVMVGVLAVLFTILTIIAAIIIYRQSKDYENKIDADRELYKKQIKEFLDSQKEIIQQKSETIKELSEKIDDTVKEYKKKLDKSSANQKKEIQKEINQLELEKSALKTDIGAITVASTPGYSLLSSSFSTKTFHKCSQCGFGFYIDTNPSYLHIGNTVTCPKCQNVETI